MDSTPLSHQSEPPPRTKSASRLARFGDSAIKTKDIPHFSVEFIRSSPKKTSPSPSTLSPNPSIARPLHELLLLSPSPIQRSKTRLSDRFKMAEEPAPEPNGPRKRCKNRVNSMGLLGCSSPRNHRRSRRRIEQEEKDLGVVEELGKAKKRRNSGRSKKEKRPSLEISSKSMDGDQSSLDRLGQLLSDLIMWKDVAKSTLWFGFGSMFFFSSGLAPGISFSVFSAISQLGLLFLGVSFFSNSFCQRENGGEQPDLRVKEDDILRGARVILPVVNLAISKTRELFSGEPSMTLKVAPFLLVGAEFGHLITFWRLFAFGFFISFTAPKLYSSYSVRINNRVEYMKWWVLETWGACSHKKIVAASAVIVFWNLSTLKTRIFTAFISLVIFRYYRRFLEAKVEEEGQVEEEEQKMKALVVDEAIEQVEEDEQKALI